MYSSISAERLYKSEFSREEYPQRDISHHIKY